MKSGEMKWEVLVRIRDTRLLKRLNEIYSKGGYSSYNKFLVSLIEQSAFKEDRQDKILEVLEEVEDKTSAIYSMVKYNHDFNKL